MQSKDREVLNVDGGGTVESSSATVVRYSSIMPALTIYKGKLFGTLTTRPLAGDDLQIVCIVLGTYRLIQLM